MKRSEMISKLTELIYENISGYGDFAGLDTSNVDKILDGLEEAGMLPTSVKAKVIKGEDYPFGTMCTMRCNCDECNPEFDMNVWEKE